MLILKIILSWIALVAAIIVFCYWCFVFLEKLSFYTDRWVDEEDDEILPVLSYEDAKLYYSLGLVENQSFYHYTHFTIKGKRFTFKNFFDFYRFVRYIKKIGNEKALYACELKQKKVQKEFLIFLQNVLQERQDELLKTTELNLEENENDKV